MYKYSVWISDFLSPMQLIMLSLALNFYAGNFYSFSLLIFSPLTLMEPFVPVAHIVGWILEIYFCQPIVFIFEHCHMLVYSKWIFNCHISSVVSTIHSSLHLVPQKGMLLIHQHNEYIGIYVFKYVNRCFFSRTMLRSFNK